MSTVVYPAPSHDPVIVGPPSSQIVGGLVATEANEANAPAGLASAAGSALQPVVAVRVNAGVASATGSALQPAVAVKPNAGAASAAGSALQPTIAIGTNAGVASATGSATLQTAALGALAGSPVAAGSAPQPTVATSGGANAPAGLAGGDGTAGQPTVALGIPAGPAAATGSAPQPAARVTPTVGVATGTGSALQPVAAITVRPAAPAAAGSAPQPTVSISGSVNAPAGLASAAGSAGAPTIAITARAGVPTAAGAASGTTIVTGKIALAGVATAAGTALAAMARITVRPPAPTAAGTAPQPATTAEVVALTRTLVLYSSRRFGADGYQPGENQTVFLPNNYRVGCPLVVVCHGTASDAAFYYGHPDRYRPLEAIANTGMIVVAGDLGDPLKPDGWGNDLSVARIDDVITWAAAEWACRTDRVSLLGDSSGGATALNWARQHPGQVAGIALRAGVCDIEAIYQGGAGNPLLVSLISSAYDGDWPAARNTHDPALNTAELEPVADRIRCYYTSGDDLVPPAATLAFANDVGCAAPPVGDMVHNDTIMTAIQSGDLASWLWSLL